MLDRARLEAGREVVGGPGGQHPVHDVEAAGHHAHGELVHAHGIVEGQRQGNQDHERQHDHRRGKQALGTPRVEPGERDPLCLLQLAYEELRDQEARDHEEDVHPHVTATRKGNASVVEEHHPDRDGPETLHVRTEVLLRTLRVRLLKYFGRSLPAGCGEMAKNPLDGTKVGGCSGDHARRSLARFRTW